MNLLVLLTISIPSPANAGLLRRIWNRVFSSSSQSQECLVTPSGLPSFGQSDHLFGLADYLVKKEKHLKRVDDLFSQKPILLKAIDFKNTSERAEFERLYKSLAETGQLPPFEGPVAPLAGHQLRTLHLRHAAHAIWIETHRKVPWSLKDYNDEEIMTLLSFNTTIGSRSAGTVFQNYFRDLTDALHSPWTQALSSPKKTIEEMTAWARDEIRHNSGQDSPKTLKEAHLGGHTGSCQHTTALMGVSAIALNIPAKVLQYPETMRSAGLHYFVDFPSEQMLLSHGDNPYSAAFKKAPVEESFIQDEARKDFISALKNDPKTADELMAFHGIDTHVRYPDESTRKASCLGRAHLTQHLKQRFGCSGAHARCAPMTYPEEFQLRMGAYHSKVLQDALQNGACPRRHI